MTWRYEDAVKIMKASKKHSQAFLKLQSINNAFCFSFKTLLDILIHGMLQGRDFESQPASKRRSYPLLMLTSVAWGWKVLSILITFCELALSEKERRHA